ncbi:MAG TPA: peptidoglycan bridge formation glycyltransferase FemA/FemB family protein [Negativicutes bacterium]|jgi:hypothetical protein
MELEIINPIYYQQWDDLVLNSNKSSFFHTSAWAKVLSKSYDFVPNYFTIIKKNELKLLLPVMDIKSYFTGRRGVSLTFTDYCDPFIEKEGQFPELLDRVVLHGKKKGWKSIEFRGGGEFLVGKPASAKYWGHTLDISEIPDKIYSGFRDSTRRNINKAVHEGITIKRLNSLQSVYEFYRLHCLTRKKHGLPPQPKFFFQNIYTYIISKNKGFVILASYNNQIIAGAIFFHHSHEAIYKYGASDEDYLKFRANNLVMWEAIKWYSNNGFTSFCFGRSDCNDKGLRQYKKGWGSVEREIKYYKYDIIKNKFIENNNTEFSNKYLQKMPLKVLRVIGHFMYRHVG